MHVLTQTIQSHGKLTSVGTRFMLGPSTQVAKDDEHLEQQMALAYVEAVGTGEIKEVPLYGSTSRYEVRNGSS